MIRRQLPVHSPLDFTSIVRATVSAAAPRTECPIDALNALLRERYRADRSVLTGSGTQALSMAIRLVRRKNDAPVALPAFACYDVATAAIGADASVILYDIDPDTLGPDWESLEWALEQGARTVVVAYLYGIPVHWDRVEDLANRYSAAVVEDAAQGVGGSWLDRPLGSLGPMSVLSFGRGKGWTGGRGGALLFRGVSRTGDSRGLETPNPPATQSWYRILVGLLAQLLLARPSIYGLPYRIPWLHLGETRYREPEPVRRMSRISAAHVLATSQATQEEAVLRRRVARELAALLEGTDGIRRPVPPEGTTPGHLRLACRITDPALRRRILARCGPAGVTSTYPTTLDKLPAMRPRLDARTRLPGAETLARQLVTFPVHSRVSPHDLACFQATLNPQYKIARTRKK